MIIRVQTHVRIIMMRRRFSNYLFLALSLVLAVCVSFGLHLPLLFSLVLFYGVPALFFSYRNPHLISRAVEFSLISTVFFFLIDYIAVRDGAWFVSTIFPFRFLSILPIEDFVWLFLGVYCMVMFYELFDDKGYHKKRSLVKYLLFIVALFVLLFLILFFYFPTSLHIPFAYYWIGVVFGVLPIVVILWKYRPLRTKFFRTAIYIFVVHIAFEYTALKLGYWSFPGKNYIGWLNVGGVQVPVEEFLIWITLGSMTILSYYEFYDDDRR